MNETESRSLVLAQQWLGRSVTVSIDRPIGSQHPRWGFVYPVNYGYLAGVIAPDGGGLDAYVLGVEAPLDRFTGRCIAIVHRLDDDDDKLVVVPEGMSLTDKQICAQTWFQEQFFESRIVREKHEAP